MTTDEDSTAATYRFEVTAIPQVGGEGDMITLGVADSVGEAWNLAAAAEEGQYLPSEYRIRRVQD